MDVSIIIVNYNTLHLLTECIDSIRSHTYGIEYEIIVVDNASSDGSVDFLKRHYPEVMTIEAGDNLGFGRANNIGITKSCGRYLFLLNSDTLLINNAVKIFYERAEKLASEGRQIGAIGSILLGKDRNTCHSYGQFITPKSELKEVMSKYLRFLKSASNTHPLKINGEINVDYVTGADMFIPRNVINATKGFDPDYFMYCEEVDWQKRMSEYGYERLIVEGPGIIHLEGGSDSKGHTFWKPSRLKNLYTSRKIYRRKHFNKLILPAINFLLGILDLPSVLLIALLTKNKEYLKLIFMR